MFFQSVRKSAEGANQIHLAPHNNFSRSRDPARRKGFPPLQSSPEDPTRVFSGPRNVAKGPLMDLDDTAPKRKPEIAIGEDLALLSVAELEQRIQVLEAEIARFKASIAGKQASKTAADAFFRN